MPEPQYKTCNNKVSGWVLGLRLFCSKTFLLFFSALLQKLTDYAFRFTYYSQLFSEVATPTSSLVCIAVVLAFPVDIWWLWSFTISIVDSFLAYFSITWDNCRLQNTAMRSPFHHFCRYTVAQDTSPDLVVTGNESRAIKCCCYSRIYARYSHMPIIPQIMPE